MDSSVLAKDKIWILRVCHHVSNALYQSMWHNIPEDTDLLVLFYLEWAVVKKRNGKKWYIQQSSCNPMSSNLEILIIQHLSRVAQDQKLCFYRKKTSSKKVAYLRDMFKKLYKSVCHYCIFYSINFFSYEASKIHIRGLW